MPKTSALRPGKKAAVAGAVVVIALSLIAWRSGALEYLHRKVAGWERFRQKVHLSDVRLCTCRPDEDVRFPRADGVTIAASLYGLHGGTARPVVLLLHGNTPVGRRLPVYRILASELAEHGYLVLTFDFAGFGESGDPLKIGTRAALAGERDVEAALVYVRSLRLADTASVHIIAHSQGSLYALSPAIRDPGVTGLALLGPPRRLQEWRTNEGRRDHFWARAVATRRRIYQDTFPSWYTRDLWLEEILSRDMIHYVKEFSRPDHKPLLLVDGELESAEDHAFLREYFERLTEPKQYLTVPRSDHYANTGGFLGWVFYDRTVVAATVDAIDGWIAATGAPDGQR